MSTFYLDFEGGSDANNGTTFALRWKTITLGATAARTAPGDTIRIKESLDPTSTGVNATFTNNSPTITLASALNALITDCETAWVASANITCNTYQFGGYAQGTTAVRHQIAAGFTTGKIAYFDLGSNQDYSAYQGISLWMYFYGSTPPADGTFEIKLCSDTTGDTPVDTFSVVDLNLGFVWTRLYMDKGSALGAAIRSIALYATADPGTADVYFDNIMTTKAAGDTCLNLLSLIGKQNGADGGWYPIRYISGVSVVLNVTSIVSSQPTNSAPGFYGTTESVTAYIRKPFAIYPTTAGVWGQMAEVGTAGNLITYSGGWNRTDMSTQTSTTYFAGNSEQGTAIAFQSYTRVDKLNPVYWTKGINLTIVVGCEIGTMDLVQADGYLLQATFLLIEALTSNGCSNTLYFGITAHIRIISIVITNGSATNSFSHAPIFLGDQTSAVQDFIVESYVLRGSNSYGMSWTQGNILRGVEFWVVDIKYSKGTGTWGFFVDIGLQDVKFGTVSVTDSVVGFYIGGGTGTVKSLTTANNSTCGLLLGSVSANQGFGEVIIQNISLSDSTPVVYDSLFRPSDSWVFARNYNGVTDDNRGWYDSGWARMFSELGANRHTLSGIGWRIDVLSALYDTNFPVRFKITSLILEENVVSKLRLWVKRSSTSISARLHVYANEVNGVVDTVDTIVSGAGTWEELEISITPTEAEQLDVYLEVWGGSTNSVYFDDFSVI